LQSTDFPVFGPHHSSLNSRPNTNSSRVTVLQFLLP